MPTTKPGSAATSVRGAGRPAKPRLDGTAAAAVELARTAAEEVAGPGEVGEHLGAVAEGERVATHRFAATHRGYRGWAWAVTLARAPRARVATVSEVVLLPAAAALLAPPWVPWADRVQPGDLGPTDLLPYRADDPQLDEGFESLSGAGGETWAEQFDDADALQLWELGLGRTRVINRVGRGEAATRWYRGPEGPDTPAARAATEQCATCGYLVGLRGSLRQLFGVCANAWSPEDGKVVSLDHGCGAHSETGREAEPAVALPDPLLDELNAEFDTAPAPEEAEEGPDGQPPPPPVAVSDAAEGPDGAEGSDDGAESDGVEEPAGAERSDAAENPDGAADSVGAEEPDSAEGSDAAEDPDGAEDSASAEGLDGGSASPSEATPPSSAER